MRICPLCEGTGVYLIKGESDDKVNLLKNIMKMRNKGLSLRQIGSVLGIAPNTVLYHLRKQRKNP